MKCPVKVIENKLNGQKWEIFKRSENEYFYKYYEFHSSCGWKFMWREGDHKKGYLTREYIMCQFDIFVP